MTACAGAVHLHKLELDASGSLSVDCWRILDGAERARARRFRSDELRRQWTASRAGLRSILSSYCDCSPTQLAFAYGPFGKPVVSGPASKAGITFNLSHSDRVAVVAVGFGAEVGVDVERKKPVRDWPGVARRFFSAREYAELMAVEEPLRLDAFFHCWTRKEAVIKATGEGLRARLDDFDVSLSPDAKVRVVADYSDEQKYVGWRLRSFELRPGYTGALATAAGTELDILDHGEWRFEHA